jgi:hypothetical protein
LAAIAGNRIGPNRHSRGSHGEGDELLRAPLPGTMAAYQRPTGATDRYETHLMRQYRSER